MQPALLHNFRLLEPHVQALHEQPYVAEGTQPARPDRQVEVRAIPELLVYAAEPAEGVPQTQSSSPPRSFAQAIAQQIAKEAPVPTRPQLVPPPPVVRQYTPKPDQIVVTRVLPRPPILEITHHVSEALPKPKTTVFSIVRSADETVPQTERFTYADGEREAATGAVHPSEIVISPLSPPITVENASNPVIESFSTRLEVVNTPRELQLEQLLLVLPEAMHAGLATVDNNRESAPEQAQYIESLMLDIALHANILNQKEASGERSLEDITELTQHLTEQYELLGDALGVTVSEEMIATFIAAVRSETYVSLLPKQNETLPFAETASDAMQQDAAYTLSERFWRLFNHLAGIAVRGTE